MLSQFFLIIPNSMNWGMSVAKKYPRQSHHAVKRPRFNHVWVIEREYD